jgi:hypothetical protein
MAKTIVDLANDQRTMLAGKVAERKSARDEIDAVRAACAADNRDPSTEETAKVRAADAKITALDPEIDAVQARIAEYDGEIARDNALDRLTGQTQPTGVTPPEGRAADHGAAVVTREERTYTPEKSSRGEASFFADAYRFQQGDFNARERLERHAGGPRRQRVRSASAPRPRPASPA